MRIIICLCVLGGALSLTQLDYEEEIEDVNDENHEFDLLSAAKYLKQYGYLSENYTITSLQEKNYKDDILSQAILKFQDFYDITGDGILNNETIQLMKKPRCGVQDHPEKFTIYRDRVKWKHNKIRWKFLLGSWLDQKVAQKCFEEWARHTNLSFYRNETSPNILISYGRRYHKYSKRCMGISKCPYDFDGRGLVLGHSHYPDGVNEGAEPCYEIHLDIDERWDRNITNKSIPYGYTSLYQTLLHEIGHSLGLFHSSANPSVMYSFYNDSRSKLELEQDDIYAIQSLYGKPKRFNVRNKKVLNSPTMRTPTTTTTTTDVISLNPPNLCSVNNNIDRILVVNNHLYLFYKDWVWVISLNKKRIEPPMRLKDYIGIPELNFHDGGHIYQRPSGEIILFHKTKYYLIDSTNFKVQYEQPIENMGLPKNIIIQGVVNTYTGKTYIIFNNNLCVEYDECAGRYKSIKLIDDVFPGIPQRIDHVFRYTNGKIYFFKNKKVYEFDEFLGKVISIHENNLETIIDIPCQNIGILHQLQLLLKNILSKNIVTEDEHI
ncbi:hypothetical protein WA026_023694 [Henosepilachna vigintioctopunctata]|uniref:Peptidase metallopeptidase domain-containing protein n=1 Tax=Henosepilachna vigintioctopunctata TaxID=420089 RepID=A0AAW1UK72_9CUCU